MATKSYVLLIRGINVGGKNKVPMPALKQLLEKQGFENVRTYIQSGNVVLDSTLDANALASRVEQALPAKFTLDRSIIRVLALDQKTFKEIVALAPKEFGEDDELYRYYVLFLIDTKPAEAMKDIEVRDGVDTAWEGKSVIYYRLPSLKSRDATKSRLNKVTQKPLYQLITMRNWKTTTKLLELLEQN